MLPSSIGRLVGPISHLFVSSEMANRKSAFAATLCLALLTACGAAPDHAAEAQSPGHSAQAQPVEFFALSIGKTAQADGAVVPLTQFLADDRIIASVSTRGAGKQSRLSVRMIAMADGAIVSEQSRVRDLTGPAFTAFEFPRPSSWAAGRYLVEAWIAGNLQARQEIEVGTPVAAPGS